MLARKVLALACPPSTIRGLRSYGVTVSLLELFVWVEAIFWERDNPWLVWIDMSRNLKTQTPSNGVTP